MTNYLSGGKVNLSQLQEMYRKELLRLIDKCDGPKAIVWDDALGVPFGVIAKSSVLRDHNVLKMYQLNFGKLPVLKDVKNIIFISRAHEDLMDMVADNIHGEERSGIRKEYHLFFVPRNTTVCRKRLSEKGVLGNFTYIEDIKCDIFPFDYDLLSMEVENTFKDLYLYNDPTTLYQAAQAIQTLQSLYGPINKISAIGEAAVHVNKLVDRLSREPHDFPSHSQIDHLVLIDRSVDLLTPLVTQLTYEGLIDEIYEIKNMNVFLPADKFADSNDEPNTMISPKKTVILNSADELYAKIRDKSFSAVGPALNKKTQAISKELEERNTDRSIDQMKNFVEKLPALMENKKSLGIHLTIAKLIREIVDSDDFNDTLKLEQSLLIGVESDKVQTYIEDMIAHQVPIFKVLRLICIQSFTNSGLKPKVLEYYKKEIVQTYGFEHIITLSKLEDAGLLRVQSSGKRVYTILKKTLKLIVEDGSETSPTDISYVHSIYAPLSIKLVENLVRTGSWRSLTNDLMLLTNKIVHPQQAIINNQTRRTSIGSHASSLNENTKVFLVFFLGGCTFSEIAALRFLSRQDEPNNNVEFVIATTKLINGNTFLQSLVKDP
ncbi:Vacuolar protein sorting-associated protein [Nesidiocoris tenuis]|uniref:Vacuolar protein sorting-associated protein n=1 Tax=Nesidiocoris tenuis TaxID=355587 RepID=A0ABN7B1A4_9HEMI|nr:Vacuolar protein sorting-associated protein [Nesidiocoris tenuis]